MFSRRLSATFFFFEQCSVSRGCRQGYSFVTVLRESLCFAWKNGEGCKHVSKNRFPVSWKHHLMISIRFASLSFSEYLKFTSHYESIVVFAYAHVCSRLSWRINRKKSSATACWASAWILKPEILFALVQRHP